MRFLSCYVPHHLIGLVTVALLAPMTNALPCDTLKATIQSHLHLPANSIYTYHLSVLPINQKIFGKVVGTCDGGAHKILLYRLVADPFGVTPQMLAQEAAERAAQPATLQTNGRHI